MRAVHLKNQEGNSKVVVCPDARENLGFSVQTGASRLQKILSAILTAARA